VLPRRRGRSDCEPSGLTHVSVLEANANKTAKEVRQSNFRRTPSEKNSDPSSFSVDARLDFRRNLKRTKCLPPSCQRQQSRKRNGVRVIFAELPAKITLTPFLLRWTQTQIKEWRFLVIPLFACCFIRGRPCGIRTCDQRIKRLSYPHCLHCQSGTCSACQDRKTASFKSDKVEVLDFTAQLRHSGKSARPIFY
jgi:hypothetical protein